MTTETPAKTTTTRAKAPATPSYSIPHVHQAISEILADLSVEKNGTLPPNMGGKPYISAVDLNSEIKRRFVEKKLILVPNEAVVKHEVITGAKTINVVSVTGTYEIISLEDGSNLSISGTGDGLSMGSSVASNIASTNALKNAFLRFFLVTEQSVEDESKKELPDNAPAAPIAPPAPPAEVVNLDALKNEVFALLKARGEIADGLTKDQTKARITELGDEFFAGRKGWDTAAPALQRWVDHLKSGEVK